jgi:hypothetical protein
MKHIYTPFLAIFLFFVIIGFSIYKQLENSTEGLENMDPSESNVIITRNKNKVRRRKKSIKVDKTTSKVYRENFNIGNAFKSLGDKISKSVIGPIKSWGDKTIKEPFTKAFKKFMQFFQAIRSYIMCGVDRIKSLPGCMQWYLLEVFGKILYTPIKFMVWIGKLQKIEREMWRNIENIDRTFYKFTGFHLIHYSDEIIKNCYKCRNLVPFPK